MTKNPNWLFSLRVKLFINEPHIHIHAFDGGPQSPNHRRIDVEVKQGSKVVFPLGVLYCGLPRSRDPRSVHAKELVMALVAMKPGDTDPDYFDDYTPEQLAWARHNGEALTVEHSARYCDENGNVKA